MDVVATVTKLIALSTSPNEHEARTAAFQACKMILQNSLMVCVKTDPWSPPPYRPPIRKDDVTKRIVAKFGGTCRCCGSTYGEGDYIHWAKGRGAVCTRSKCRELFERGL